MTQKLVQKQIIEALEFGWQWGIHNASLRTTKEHFLHNRKKVAKEKSQGLKIWTPEDGMIEPLYQLIPKKRAKK
jgi:hypothetical protein